MGDYNENNIGKPDDQNGEQPQSQQPQYDQTQNQPQSQQPQYQQPQNQQPQYGQSEYQQSQYQPQYQQPQYSGQTQYQNQQYQQYQQNPYQQYQPEQDKDNGMAIASLVCGIVSVVLSCCLWYITLPVSIVGLILGILVLKNKKGGRNMAIVGVVLSSVGILFGVMGLVTYIFWQSAGYSIINELKTYGLDGLDSY